MGPLIVVGISVRFSQLEGLRKIGIKDSKLLTPLSRRRMLSSMMDYVESVCICKLYSNRCRFWCAILAA